MKQRGILEKLAANYANQAAAVLQPYQASGTAPLWHSIRTENAPAVLQNHTILPRVLANPTAVEATVPHPTEGMARAEDVLSGHAAQGAGMQNQYMQEKYKIQPSGVLHPGKFPNKVSENYSGILRASGASAGAAYANKGGFASMHGVPGEHAAKGVLPIQEAPYHKFLSERNAAHLAPESGALFSNPSSVSLAKQNPLRRYGNVHALVRPKSGFWFDPKITISDTQQVGGNLQRKAGPVAKEVSEITGVPRISQSGQRGTLPTAQVQKYFYDPKALIAEHGKDKGIVMARGLKASGRAIPITRRVEAVMRRFGAAVR